MAKGFKGILALAVGAGLLWLSGCATTGVPGPSAEILSRAQARWPGTTQADLVEGRGLYVEHCAACHDLHDASDLSPAGWERIMARMQKKAHIDDVTKDRILKYLESATERAADAQ
ncbi:MAG TPA: cytochrome c [bacterium]|nr:cytochrome c [bacterium]